MAAKKANKEKLRETAEDMFIRQCRTAIDISETLGVSTVTMSKWRKGRPGEKTWDERKRDAQLTPLKIKELLTDEAYNIAQGKPATINSDNLNKLISTIEKMDKKVSARVVTDVLKLLDNWLAETNPKIAVEMLQVHKQFIQYRISLEM